MTKLPDPEKIYSQVPDGISRWKDALPYVMRALAFDEAAIPTVDSTPNNHDSATFRVSERLQEEEYRTAEFADSVLVDPFAIAKRVLRMKAKYPFVPQSRLGRSVSPDESFRDDVCNHIVDGDPGIFGITDEQAGLLRHHVQHGLLQDPKAVRELIDSINVDSEVPETHTHDE